MSEDVLAWEKLIEGLRPLGDAMRERMPERLRGDPQVMAESMRLLLAGLARASSDAMVGNRQHPMFVPELNIAQNIFQPNADTIYKSAIIEKGWQLPAARRSGHGAHDHPGPDGAGYLAHGAASPAAGADRF